MNNKCTACGQTTKRPICKIEARGETANEPITWQQKMTDLQRVQVLALEAQLAGLNIQEVI